jgi:hypothetical protein
MLAPRMPHSDKVMDVVGRTRLSAQEVADDRDSRRFPRPTQFDYLHLRYLIDSLGTAFNEAPGPVRDVLDIFCGARPYDDLLPPGARL